ncbi:MAG: bile acid:sodium symporter family protein [Bacteroidota bacterium]
MDLHQFFSIIMNLSTLAFAVTSMLVMGLSLTMAQISAPLRNTHLVLAALAANFILAPALAYGIGRLLPLNDGLRFGLIVASTAAGAPFLPRLAQLAKGDVAFSVGLMGLLVITTIFYMPVVLPLLLHGVTVSPWQIARTLILLMFLPLSIGLLINSRYGEAAGNWVPYLAKASNIALVSLLVSGLIANLRAILEIIGPSGILAALLFLLSCLAAGTLLGGREYPIRSVLGLGTAQRNMAAALVVATANFSQDPAVIVMILVLGLVDLSVLLFIANRLGRRIYDPQPAG